MAAKSIKPAKTASGAAKKTAPKAADKPKKKAVKEEEDEDPEEEPKKKAAAAKEGKGSAKAKKKRMMMMTRILRMWRMNGKRMRRKTTGIPTLTSLMFPNPLHANRVEKNPPRTMTTISRWMTISKTLALTIMAEVAAEAVSMMMTISEHSGR